MKIFGFSARPALWLLAGAILSAANATAHAATVSDQLIARVNWNIVFNGTRNEPAGNGFEAPLGFAYISGGMVSNNTFNTLMGGLIGLTATGWDDGMLTSWEGSSSMMASGAELVLTEPSSSTPSDFVFRFSATVGSHSGDAVVVFSDPALVARLATLSHLNSFASIAETGSLQQINSLLYPSGTTSPFSSIQMLSAIPEPVTWGMMLAGLGLLGMVRMRRR